jgi:hypothetical protein
MVSISNRLWRAKRQIEQSRANQFSRLKMGTMPTTSVGMAPYAVNHVKNTK